MRRRQADMPSVRRGTQKMHVSIYIQPEPAEPAAAAIDFDDCEDPAGVSEAIGKLGNPRGH